MGNYVYNRNKSRRTFGRNPQEIGDAVTASGIPDDVSSPNVKPLRDTPEQRKIAADLKKP